MNMSSPTTAKSIKSAGKKSLGSEYDSAFYFDKKEEVSDGLLSILLVYQILVCKDEGLSSFIEGP